MSEQEEPIDIEQLAQEAAEIGFVTKEQVIGHLINRIKRDRKYLAYRQHSKRTTGYDDLVAMDALVTARLIWLLQQEEGQK